MKLWVRYPDQNGEANRSQLGARSQTLNQPRLELIYFSHDTYFILSLIFSPRADQFLWDFQSRNFVGRGCEVCTVTPDHVR